MAPEIARIVADAEFELRQASRIFDSLRRLKGDDDGTLERLAARQVQIADRLREAGKKERTR